ncbi:GIY-YIG nuclease family protein [Rickettsia tamurae]|uniref:GIY-YIG nuclease family protein n=1 Tax=Rickettsia tamurae TaxID=334545 RepID=UPI00308180E2
MTISKLLFLITLTTLHVKEVYILASGRNGTLYIGVTSNIIKRIYEHKHKIIKGFSSKYNINKLVYFEQYDNIIAAINREKLLKEYKRQWKLNLIESQNPEWHDLYEKIIL